MNTSNWRYEQVPTGVLITLDGFRANKTMLFPVSGHPVKKALLIHRLFKWDKDPRPFIQDAFPDLTVEQREFLISGTTPDEWDKMFSEEETE